MAYGDTGVNGGKAGTYLAADYGWTWGQIVGTDATGAPKTSDVQFVVDSGVSAPVINPNDLAGFQVVFGGVQTSTTPGGQVAAILLSGPTIKVRTSAFPLLDVPYNNTFALIPSYTLPSLLGGLFWIESKGKYTLDIKGKKLTIS